MSFRALDKNGDWTFGAGVNNLLVGRDEIAANLRTRLLSWVGNCFFDTAAGIDWVNLRDKGTQDALTSAVKTMILQTDGVIHLNSLSVSYVKRAVFITANIDTIYSRNFTLALSQAAGGSNA